MQQKIDKYRLDIYNWLFTLKMKEWVSVEAICRPKNRPMFLQTVKEFIDQKLFLPADFDIEFSEDYKRIRKIDMTPLTQNK